LAAGGGAGWPGRPQLHAGDADSAAMEDRASLAGCGKPKPAFGANGALDPPVGRQPGRALDGGACGMFDPVDGGGAGAVDGKSGAGGGGWRGGDNDGG